MKIIKDDVNQVFKLKHSNGIDIVSVDICEYETNKEVRDYAKLLLNEKAMKREMKR